jgi:hypothetical protein
MERKILGIVLLALTCGLIAGSVGTYAALQWTARIPTTAQLKLLGVGVYKDVSFTIPVTEIDWGMVEPGENKTYSVYIKNESNVPITLTMYTEGWNPSEAASSIMLTWDCDGSRIDVDTSIGATFTLTVGPATSGFRSFSFTAVIVGSG